ncbi:hypothetical protein QUF99_05940 [Bacillus sp. DX4.1]|uniref:hypothetical protein n=1 Tax=Bacillus sp. DX4.1 TaxID=3055867 RepID=UPI0025A2C335|nr:hypothetical protein [Bacillus sp. DX4.1]MDM5186911.1 hypothetical protein [Bacillus sp. DX4.1]
MGIAIGALFIFIVIGMIAKEVRSSKRKQKLYKSDTGDSSATTSTPFFFAGSDSSNDCGSSFGGDSGSSGGDGGGD